MTQWVKRQKQNIWDGFSDVGVESGMLATVGSSVIPAKNQQWVPDTKRGWGMKRADPIIRFEACTVVPARFYGCQPSWRLIFVSYNRELTQDDFHNREGWELYQKDVASPQFIGFHKSISPVITQLKKWMKEN